MGGTAGGTGQVGVLSLSTPLTGGASEEVVRCMEGTLESKEGGGVGEVMGGCPGRFGGRGREGGGARPEKEGVGEVTESAEVVDSERKEGDIIGVEICNKDGSVNLAMNFLRMLELIIRESEYVITVTIRCVSLTTNQRIRTRMYKVQDAKCSGVRFIQLFISKFNFMYNVNFTGGYQKMPTFSR